MNEDFLNTIINIGYACLWIATISIDINENEEALYFLKYAKNCWDKTSPPRSKELEIIWNQVKISDEIKSKIENLSEWKIKDHCSSIVANKLI